MLNLIKKILKQYPVIDLGQENSNSASRRISLKLVAGSVGAKALDAGCREGRQTKILEDKGYDVISIDIDNKYNKCQIVDLNKKLPFNDESMEMIYCSEVLEHLSNPDFTISEFVRILAIGGKIILTTPNSYCIWFRILYFCGLKKEKIQKEDHIQFFKITDMYKLFPSACILGFWPFIFKFKLTRGVSLLSPTFIVHTTKSL